MFRRSLTVTLFAILVGGHVARLVAEEQPAVAMWSFDGDLVDRSGRGNHAFGEPESFTAGHSGQGLQCASHAVVVPDSPELRPAPGLHIECWAKFETIGTSWQPLLIKDGEYQLRLDPPDEGGQNRFRACTRRASAQVRL